MYKKIVKYLNGLKKEQLLICALIAGLLLIVAIPTKKQTDSSKEQLQASVEAENMGSAGIRQQLETQLADALSQMEGVGKVQVVLTLESSTKKEVEKDVPASQSSQSESGDGRNLTSDSGSSEETTVYEKKSDGSQTPYVVSETMPEVRGVLVVAQGADNPQVVKQISEGIMALFRVEAHKIKVVKMK